MHIVYFLNLHVFEGLITSTSKYTLSFARLIIIHLMSNEQVSLTFTIKSITNCTTVLLIFEDFSTNSTDFESV